jgi:uncharacterized damage-inducible protein DinB
MMKSLLTTQLNYHYWAHRRVWACIEPLSDEDYFRMAASGSIHDQVFRMMAAENLWINFLWHEEVEFLTLDQFPTRAAIRSEWSALEEEMRDYVDGLREDELQRVVTPPFWKNRVRVQVWEALLQVFNHAVDSRARLLTALELVGAQTTSQDFSEHIYTARFHHPLAAVFESGVIRS